ncbi:MAG: PadR family transcriptional regulator [Anaerorhabdus sp.]|uniref:PadR family transcriptional regulator n=1 Tax=Anaerorhabdus sp. TaxID=1872524 RepID=UPI003A849C14
MLIMSDIIRGYTDTFILAQILHKDSYGYEINKAINEMTNGRFELKEATLYTTFRRLEQGGYIISYWGDENTGARRRYYAITEKGKELYYENLNDWKIAKTMINQILADKNDE